MSITPRGMSVQEAYRLYRSDSLFVNRRYQRKLVWSVSEKQLLIESILDDYPIPLILFAERPEIHGSGKYEILDGMQRLDAVFSFIEQHFDFDGRYFDVSQSARAAQVAESDVFTIKQDVPLLSANDCANFLDYQLAVTIYPTSSEQEVTEVFRRINANGRQLSRQEKRQAGVLNDFTELVRSTASRLRGDVSNDILMLHKMPSISVESNRERQSYGVRAEDTLWCRYGVLNSKQLREGEDEQIIADLAASILLGAPLAVSSEVLDDLYDTSSSSHARLASKLARYGRENLEQEIEATFSILSEILDSQLKGANSLRNLVRPGSVNPAKTPFYSIFMALFKLIVQEQKSPVEYDKIVKALHGVGTKLTTNRHHAATEDRENNIKVVTGLIQDHFVKKTPPAFGHGAALAIDFANSLRRSKIETGRYEFKQGLVTLDHKRAWDNDLANRIAEIICGIANSNPKVDGYLFIGVADKPADAERVKSLDLVEPVQVGPHKVVGIDREAKLLGIKLEDYVEKLVQAIRSSDLTEPLKSQVLTSIDTIEFQGLSVIRVIVPGQSDAAFVGDTAFVRQNSSTVRVEGRQLAAIVSAFRD